MAAFTVGSYAELVSTLAAPRSTAPCVQGDSPARVHWETRPRGRTEQWFRELGGLQASGRIGRNGLPGQLAFAVLLTEYRDAFRLAAPDPLLRGAFAALAVFGRPRGYRTAASG
jgi:hypothetical protein